jgi:hypothetical protein
MAPTHKQAKIAHMATRKPNIKMIKHSKIAKVIIIISSFKALQAKNYKRLMCMYQPIKITSHM